MYRHEVEFKTKSLGDRKHVVKAKDAEQVREKIKRAYPDQIKGTISVKRITADVEGKV